MPPATAGQGPRGLTSRLRWECSLPELTAQNSVELTQLPLIPDNEPYQSLSLGSRGEGKTCQWMLCLCGGDLGGTR